MFGNQSLETQGETFHGVILGKTAEYWEEKNEAMIKLTKSVREVNLDTLSIEQQFTAKFFSFLKDPVKLMISDLRSQQVKEVCNLLTAIVEVTKEHVRTFLREIFVVVLDAIKVPHKLMSGYVDDFILVAIRNGSFKFMLAPINTEITENKSAKVRERCLVIFHAILNVEICFMIILLRRIMTMKFCYIGH